MATVTKPMALDESMNTTESTSRNIADVLAQELSGIASAITGGDDKANKTDIATVESTNTASRAYSVGELVYVNGNLYKVITAITIGATFTFGTNIELTTVSNELNNQIWLSADKSVSKAVTANMPVSYGTVDVALTGYKVIGAFITYKNSLYDIVNLITNTENSTVTISGIAFTDFTSIVNFKVLYKKQ